MVKFPKYSLAEQGMPLVLSACTEIKMRNTPSLRLKDDKSQHSEKKKDLYSEKCLRLLVTFQYEKGLEVVTPSLKIRRKLNH